MFVTKGWFVCEDGGHPLKTNSIMARGRPKKYKTEEERKTANRERANLRYQRLKDNDEFRATQRAKSAEFYQKNRDNILAQNANYRLTPKGRAKDLLNAYRRADKKYNRGECTITDDWIVDNIFSGQVCAHCGESDWTKLGCNRLDNSLPHTPSNVEPCCWKCNHRLGIEDCKKTVYQYTLDGLLVAIWPSVKECGRNGYNYGNVAACCRGKLKRYKGYRWSYEPLQQVRQLEFNFK